MLFLNSVPVWSRLGKCHVTEKQCCKVAFVCKRFIVHVFKVHVWMFESPSATSTTLVIHVDGKRSIVDGII